MRELGDFFEGCCDSALFEQRTEVFVGGGKELTFVVESGASHLVLLVVASLSLCPRRLSWFVGRDGTLRQHSTGRTGEPPIRDPPR